MPRCRSCGADILWLKNTLSGRAAPIDAEPVPGGNCSVLAPGVYCIVPAAEAAGRTDLRKSHYATCTQPAKHRKAR